MAGRLSDVNRVLRERATGPAVLCMLALTIVSFVLMAFVIAPAFGAATGGLRPFDMNFGIGAEIIYRDLPAYTDRARTLYVWFALVDFVYPLALAAFFSLLWAWMFRRTPTPLFARLTGMGVLLLPFLFALVDWLENFGFLFVIFSYPAEFPTVANLAGALKTTKPIVEIMVVLGTLLFAGVAIWHRRRRTPAAPSTDITGS